MKLKFILVVLLVLLTYSKAKAQSNFLIPVTNASGQAIAGATVTLTCLSGGCGTSTYSVVTDNTGNAQFTNVVAGRYTVTTSGSRIVTYSYTLDIPNSSSSSSIVVYPLTQAGITSAIQTACGTNAGHVFIPAGTYTISSDLNLTGLAQGCVIEGVGSYATTPGPTNYNGTVLQINFTGANTVGIDISSVVALTLRNLVISCGTSVANAPTVCLLHGRTAGSNGIQDTFDHVFLVGYSPWVYYNFRGEQVSWIDGTVAEYATTGTPITVSFANTASITSPNVTLGGGVASATVFDFGGGTMSVSSQATAAGSKLIYLDEGTGTVADVRFHGFANLFGSNEVAIGDTTGASGILQDITLELVAQHSDLTTDKVVSIAGGAEFWHVTGTSTSGVTATPFTFAGLARHSIFDFSIGTAPTTCFTSSDATGSIIILDFGCTGKITAPLAAFVSATWASSVGSPFTITDLGTCTMASGACTAQTFPSGRTYIAAPKIWLTWTGSGTCTGLLKYTVSTTQVTPASSVGTDTCVVNWFAFGN